VSEEWANPGCISQTRPPLRVGNRGACPGVMAIACGGVGMNGPELLLPYWGCGDGWGSCVPLECKAGRPASWRHGKLHFSGLLMMCMAGRMATRHVALPWRASDVHGRPSRFARLSAQRTHHSRPLRTYVLAILGRRGHCFRGLDGRNTLSGPAGH